MRYNVKDMVKDNKRVKFCYFRHSELWYETECGFKFPVPVSDVGEATFLAEDKAMYMMRYINAQIKANQTGMDEVATQLINAPASFGLNENGLGALGNFTAK